MTSVGSSTADRKFDGRNLIRQDAGRLLLLRELGLLGRPASEERLSITRSLLELGLLSGSVRNVSLLFTSTDELALTPPSQPGNEIKDAKPSVFVQRGGPALGRTLSETENAPIDNPDIARLLIVAVPALLALARRVGRPLLIGEPDPIDVGLAIKVLEPLTLALLEPALALSGPIDRHAGVRSAAGPWRQVIEKRLRTSRLVSSWDRRRRSFRAVSSSSSVRSGAADPPAEPLPHRPFACAPPAGTNATGWL